MGTAERRQDPVLRAVVEALQRQGYTVAERCRIDEAAAILFHRPPEDPGTGDLLCVTHEHTRRCLRVDVYPRAAGSVSWPVGRTVYGYYPLIDAAQPGDLAQLLVARVVSR